MAKAQKVALPVECCGKCKFSHDPDNSKNIRCYVNPPVLIVDIDCEVNSYRSCSVEADHPACEKFKQRLNS